MKVRAKVRCTNIMETDSHYSAQFSTVNDDSDDNKDFVKDEPAGSMQIMYDKQSNAGEVIQQGKVYFVDFEEVV